MQTCTRCDTSTHTHPEYTLMQSDTHSCTHIHIRLWILSHTLTHICTNSPTLIRTLAPKQLRLHLLFGSSCSLIGRRFYSQKPTNQPTKTHHQNPSMSRTFTMHCKARHGAWGPMESLKPTLPSPSTSLKVWRRLTTLPQHSI